MHRTHPPSRSLSTRIGKAHCTDVIYSAVWFTSTGELHERIYAPHTLALVDEDAPGILVATHLDFSWPPAGIAVATHREFPVAAVTRLIGFTASIATRMTAGG